MKLPHRPMNLIGALAADHRDVGAGLRPLSAAKLLVWILNSWTASGGGTLTPVLRDGLLKYVPLKRLWVHAGASAVDVHRRAAARVAHVAVVWSAHAQHAGKRRGQSEDVAAPQGEIHSCGGRRWSPRFARTECRPSPPAMKLRLLRSPGRPGEKCRRECFRPGAT